VFCLSTFWVIGKSVELSLVAVTYFTYYGKDQTTSLLVTLRENCYSCPAEVSITKAPQRQCMEESRVRRAFQMCFLGLSDHTEKGAAGHGLGWMPSEKKTWMVLGEAVVVQGQGLSLQSLLQTCALVSSVVFKMGYKSPNHF